ncbi:magnesium dechelatase SGRL, chloroplastic [Malania oleifera]|uniref:magnesium dechelatase SGRL, chloroplastic n=1 Tax=Malania oleifera TaxID=397392 RepID=UPI0025AE0BB0|nr:magnesium dechelatase SGRL, chloroplastic [Malania oleifera]
MACHFAYSFSSSSSSSFSFLHRNFCVNPNKFKSPNRSTVLFSPAGAHCGAPSSSLVFEAAWLFGPPANFEASKLEVIFKGEEMNMYSRITPRTYTLSHCDRTAKLTLSVSSIINLDQLKGWYNKDDVVAEWKKVMGEMCLHIHCYVSGSNLLQDLAAEFRYHIFCKELPLVLKAVLHGDSMLFREYPELMNASVRVYFHSSSHSYNRVERWGPLKEAAQGNKGEQVRGFLNASENGSQPPIKWGSSKSILQVLMAFLL